jgi:hypothetical protein
MTPRPILDTLASLRATLQNLEQNTDSTYSPNDLPDLKRVLHNRIAVLEIAPAPELATLPPHPSTDDLS